MPTSPAPLARVLRITKYDPAHRDARGYYTGPEDTASDHGPVEAAYLSAVAALARESGVDRLEIREPGLPGPARFGLGPTTGGYGLDGLLDLADFHDGARVALPTALELVRAMLRDHGLWCRLEAEGRFAVHVGWDQYLYVSTAPPPESGGALDRVRALGLFAEPVGLSPYDPSQDEESGGRRPADDLFWARLRWFVSAGRAGVLEEQFAVNASRWHPLTRDTLEQVRIRLPPPPRLAVWAAPAEDTGSVLAGLPEAGCLQVVREDHDGSLTGALVDVEDHAELAAWLAGARRALALPVREDQSPALFSGVLPDPDGVLRARWRTAPCPGDAHWEFLRTLNRGEVVTGTVAHIAPFHVTFVDIGGCTATVNLPELTWRRFDLPSDVVSVGQRVRAKVLDVDLVRERVSLSLRALEPRPCGPSAGDPGTAGP